MTLIQTGNYRIGLAETYSIVIAEDSLTQAEVLRQQLEEAGYRIFHGTDGKQAYAVMNQSRPDLLVADVMMPGINGCELCKKVKSDPSLKKLVRERTRDLSKLVQERKSLEESLRKSEKRYRELLENALFGVVVCDPERLISYANRAFTRLVGYSSPKELLGTPLKAFMPEGMEWPLLMKRAGGEIKIRNLEVNLHTRHQHIRNTLLTITQTGHNFTTIVSDITDRVEMEEKERKMQAALAEAKQRAEESHQQKTQFLYNMSHEIKSPLNAITGFSELAADPEIDIQLRSEYLSHVRSHSEQLNRMIRNILELARLEASKIRIQPQSCRINELLERIFVQFLEKRKNTGDGEFRNQLIKGTQDEEWMILADPGRLAQVCSHLLENAWIHGSPGYIEFGYRLDDGSIVFFVRDDGEGMDKNMTRKVFERFMTLKRLEGQPASGLGLGLTIAEGIVRMMKGEIWIDSEPGRGTTVSFSIPLKVVSPKQESPGDVPDREVMISLKGKKILVAEDNPMNYMLVKAYLDGEGVELTWARDGEEAVGCCHGKNGFDLVLMDIQMPRMDGYRAADEIRKLNPSLPIVAVTACHTDPEKKGGTAFIEILNKPVSQEQLKASLMQHLPRHANGIST